MNTIKFKIIWTLSSAYSSRVVEFNLDEACPDDHYITSGKQIHRLAISETVDYIKGGYSNRPSNITEIFCGDRNSDDIDKIIDKLTEEGFECEREE